ncbi:uncharacterized protein LOC106666348 isoform X2 [Cimex lectularius]|uniref:KASH domain-containing protein n=1 Tax=Cimex lectularius TaxID=79782 RepID=A0A8I6RP46_CIMLE|nr:uncharacterized protein LOC106666348 isoform X2 [Cimex lectularius]
MCLKNRHKMGLVGVWPRPHYSFSRLQHRNPRRKKRRICGGKRSSLCRWFCSADISTRLAKHLRHLTIIHDDGTLTDPESIMPGGFENSSMKTSFSLSSLQPSSMTLESPEHATLKDRPYSSLRKKPRRDPELDLWRRSWGSRDENKDDFWGVLKNDYQSLIMDNNLLDSCQEAKKDLQYEASPTHEWSPEEFTSQFEEINSWLDRILEAVCTKAETVVDRKLRLSHLEEMKRKTYKRKLFNNQGGRLVARDPSLKDVVAWSMQILNRKWERLVAAVTPRKRSSAECKDICPDVEQELRVLRKWIKETENKQKHLQLSRSRVYTAQELKERAHEQEAIRREIWSHGRIVRSVLRLCERLSVGECEESISSWVRGRRVEASEAAKFAEGIERRWQFLYLNCLELQFAIEHKATQLKQGSPLSASPVDSDEEPVIKYRRLTQTPPASDQEIRQFQDVDCLMEAEDSPVLEVDVDDEVMDVAEVQQVQQEQEREQENVQPSPRIFDISINADDNDSPSKEGVIRQRIELSEDHVRLYELDSKYTSRQLKHKMPKNRSAYENRVGTFCFKHQDTDTDGDLQAEEEERQDETPEVAKTEESSEEEWTYTGQVVESQPKVEVLLDRPKQEIIKQLVDQVEVLASPLRKRTDTKYRRVKEWLCQYPEQREIGDSRDASSEYTTEDDELDSRMYKNTGDSNTSVDLESTIINQDSTESLQVIQEQPRVKLRNNNKSVGQRPKSVSDASAISPTHLIDQLGHSISESAIHELSGTNGVKMDSSVHTGSTLSSSTVEDTAQTQEGSGGGYCSNSLRRRKTKLRKKNLGRKSESGSDGLLAHSDGSHPTPISPIKFPLAKLALRRLSADKAFSDSPHRRYVVPVDSPSSNSSSEVESDGSEKQRRKLTRPDFRIGPAFKVSTYAEVKPVVSNDSSYSEQAWDNYQEKYMSEPYSEDPPDSEAARKLLDFGDDYRNYLDSQSDCASSLGRNTFHRRPRNKPYQDGEPTSDLDDVRKLIKTSNERYLFSEQFFSTHLSRMSPIRLIATDFANHIATCKENVEALALLLEKLEEEPSLPSTQECKEIRSLIEKWGGLEKKSEELRKMWSLRREMSSMEDEMLAIGDAVARLAVKVESRDQLEHRIQQVQIEVGKLNTVKQQLFRVNVDVHQFVTKACLQESTLKDDIARLYRTFEDVRERVSSEEESLKELTKTWQQFESYLSNLQVELRNDSETLRLLDQALMQEEEGGGSVPPHLATSVRDLAKILTEKPQDPLITDPQTVYDMTPCGGNYSDSGISDSGSEGDLSEREKKLAALRRLVRHLEAVLAPGSAAIVNMAKRLEQTEKDLRGLQVTCRDLIVRTNVCAEAKTFKSDYNGNCANGKLPRVDDESGTRGSRGWWFWRALRAGLPFQIAVMAIFCIACLLEPQCCDAMNNLSLSISPQLRYVRGPPPV